MRRALCIGLLWLAVGSTAQAQITSRSPFQGPRGLTGSAGATGGTGATGAAGAAGVNAFSYPNARTLSLSTAYQCTDTTKPCLVTINIQSTASISLTGGATNTGNALIGSTNGVASGTGSVLCVHGNSNTGTLTIGLGLSTIATTQCTLPVPTGGFFAVRQIAGTISILSAFDQAVG